MHYRKQWELSNLFKYSIEELEDMMPYENSMFYDMTAEHVKKINDAKNNEA